MSKSRMICGIGLAVYMVGLYTFAGIYFRKDIKAWLRRKFRKDKEDTDG